MIYFISISIYLWSFGIVRKKPSWKKVFKVIAFQMVQLPAPTCAPSVLTALVCVGQTSSHLSLLILEGLWKSSVLLS